MKKPLIPLLLTSFFVINSQAAPTVPATNKDGSIVSGILTASYDPLGTFSGEAVFPFPINLLFLGTDDGTLAPPPTGGDPGDFSDPSVALSALDGFSTTEKWVTSFADGRNGDFDNSVPGQIDPASVVAGQSVRVFQVTTDSIVVVTGIIRELTAGVDFLTAVAGNNVAIVPLKPLPELSSFMAVLTNDINDTSGNDATPDRTYYFTKSLTPWLDENGNSTSPLFNAATAAGLEQQRRITFSMESAAESAGIPREDIVLSWTVQTQSITPTMKILQGMVKPAPATVGWTQMNTSVIGAPGIADIYAGIISLPYYLGAKSDDNPLAPLTDFWKAAPGGYVPPFDALAQSQGWSMESTNLTVFNPIPVQTGTQTVPVLLTVPNASSGQSKPLAGWPTVIFAHTIGGNRTQVLAVADTLASIGYAAIAIDLPLHGVVPDVEPHLAGFYIGNTPFAPIANERTFDADYVNNATRAPGPDGVMDASGTHFLNPLNFLVTRDNMRQGSIDLSVLAASIPLVSIDGDSLPDLDGSNLSIVSVSLGSVLATPFLAIEPRVNRGFLSTPAGGMMRTFEASPTFGPALRAALAAAGIQPGTADYESFFTVGQTIIDAADAINWAAEAAEFNSITLHEVVNDTVFPNFVLTAALSGTEPLINVMGLTLYSSTQSAPPGVKIAGRFLSPASHGSLLDPSASGAATVEMQRQMATFVATRGTTVVVNDTAVMSPAAAPAQASE